MTAAGVRSGNLSAGLMLLHAPANNELERVPIEFKESFISTRKYDYSDPEKNLRKLVYATK